MTINLLKSLLHNLGVVIVSLALAYLGTSVDPFLGIPRFSSLITGVFGVLLISLGFTKCKNLDLHPGSRPERRAQHKK